MEILEFNNSYLVDKILGIVNLLLDSHQVVWLSFFGSTLGGKLPDEFLQLPIRAIELCGTDISEQDPVVQLLKNRGIVVLI